MILIFIWRLPIIKPSDHISIYSAKISLDTKFSYVFPSKQLRNPQLMRDLSVLKEQPPL